MKVYSHGHFYNQNIKKNLLFCKKYYYPTEDLDYSFFAEHICYECQEDPKRDDKFIYHLVRTSPLYYKVVYQIEDNPKDMPLPSSENSFRGNIEAYDGEKLLLTIRCDDFFFEVECNYISISDGTALHIDWSARNTKFYSHKYSEEEMEKMYSYSKELFDGGWRTRPFTTYISKIERMNSDADISSKFLENRLPFGFNSPDYNTGYYSGIPKWGENITNEELSCSIIVYSDMKKVVYKIEKDDFKMTNYETDRDGGWFVYLRKDYVEGRKMFKTVYDIQDYLVRIAKKANVNYKYPGEIDLTCKYPFKHETFIPFTCSIDEFFSEIEVDDFYTVKEERRDNVPLTWLSKYEKMGYYKNS